MGAGRPVAAAAALVSVLVLGLSGCGAGSVPAPGAEGVTTVENCGRQVGLDRRPERVVALGPSEVTTLVSAGAASRLVGRDDAGEKSSPYTPEVRDAVAAVPQLGAGGEVSREEIIALQPDLVVGSVTETITPETLGAVGVPMLSLRGNCGSNHAPGGSDGTADFEDVISDVELLGRLLGTTDRASASVADISARVARARPPVELQGRTVATAIVVENGVRIYGRRSMAHTQVQALGARDVFGDVDSRVFEAGVEELVERNPQVVVLLSYGESDQQARETFLRTTGAADLAAVRSGALFVQPYEWSSQGTLSVLGLENMSRNLASPR